MIVDDKVNKEIDKKVSKGMKPGFWAGVVSFLIAKITHVLVTFAIGLFIGINFEITQNVVDFLSIIDSPVFGLVYLVFFTRLFYRLITR